MNDDNTITPLQVSNVVLVFIQNTPELRHPWDFVDGPVPSEVYTLRWMESERSSEKTRKVKKQENLQMSE